MQRVIYMREQQSPIANLVRQFFGLEVDSIYIAKDVIGRLTSICFERSDQARLRFFNEMVDISERIEEGCLCAELVEDVNGEKVTLADNRKINLNITALLFSEHHGNPEPSGISFQIQGVDESHFVIVGAAPYTLVFKSNLYLDKFKPEYDLSDYRVEPVLEV
jgi:hypothetical protein